MVINLSLTEDSKYLITGSVKQILDNKRAKMLLRNNFNFTHSNDEIIITSEERIERIAELLGLVTKYIDATIIYDSEISNDIKKFKEKEENFIEFTQQAKNIKENNCNIDEFRQFTSAVEASMPTRSLYPLQLLSAYHLAFSQNGCNFSVPGAGKTSIVYGAYAYLKSLPDENIKKVNKILIIGPLSAFGPWELEYEECFGIKPKCKRISGNISTESKKQYFFGETDEVILTSYASVVSIRDSLKYFLSNNKVMVVLDEAHKIKNTSGGITATTIMDLASLCSARVVLTGTPAPNGYEDLYNLFEYIWPNKNVTKYTIGQLKDMSRQSLDGRITRLMGNIDPYFIRIKKEDLNIPPPIENAPLRIAMKESQRRIYDFIEERFIDETSRLSKDFHSSLIRARLIRLQQVATNPALLRIPLTSFSEDSGIDFTEIASEENLIMKDILRFYSDETPAKFIKCSELIQDIIAQGGKVVIWAIFIDTIKSFAAYLQTLNIQSRSLYGATPVATDGMSEDDEKYELTREAIIKEFHNPDSSFKVIIANPFAVAESISLHKACHNAIYLERSFNCAHFIQSKDRIHRYGLAPDVVTNYYYLLSEDSVDETINDRLAIKEERMNRLIESSPIPLFENIGDEGNEDIKTIISDYVKRKNRKL